MKQIASVAVATTLLLGAAGVAQAATPATPAEPTASEFASVEAYPVVDDLVPPGATLEFAHGPQFFTTGEAPGLDPETGDYQDYAEPSLGQRVPDTGVHEGASTVTVTFRSATASDTFEVLASGEALASFGTVGSDQPVTVAFDSEEVTQLRLKPDQNGQFSVLVQQTFNNPVLTDTYTQYMYGFSYDRWTKVTSPGGDFSLEAENYEATGHAMVLNWRGPAVESADEALVTVTGPDGWILHSGNGTASVSPVSVPNDRVLAWLGSTIFQPSQPGDYMVTVSLGGSSVTSTLRADSSTFAHDYYPVDPPQADCVPGSGYGAGTLDPPQLRVNGELSNEVVVGVGEPVTFGWDSRPFDDDRDSSVSLQKVWGPSPWAPEGSVSDIPVPAGGTAEATITFSEPGCNLVRMYYSWEGERYAYLTVEETRTKPHPPLSVSAEGGYGAATVIWTQPAYDGGSPITGYTVTSSPGGKTCSTAGATSCTVSGLSDWTSYTFMVTATNAFGTSVPSAPSNAATPETGGIHTIRGSFMTADGVPYAGVEWSAQSADGSLTDQGKTNADGKFSVLAPTTSDMRIAFHNAPRGWQSGLFFCGADSVNDYQYLLVPAGQSRLDIRTQEAHEVTVLVTDKFGKPVRNAFVAPGRAEIQEGPDGPYLPYGASTNACHPLSPQFSIDPLMSTSTGGDGWTPSHAVRIGGWIPGHDSGTTQSTGEVVISTPGPLPAFSEDFARVSAGIRPGATQRTTVPMAAIEGSDPKQRLAVAVLPYAPIMEDAATAGAVPGEESGLMRTRSTTAAPTVIVRQPNGQALSNAEVQVVPVLTGDTPAAPREGSVAATATTGGDGRATFTGLPSGKFRAIPVNVSARTVDFTVSGAGDTQPPVTQPPVTQPPVTQPPVTQPPVTQPPVTSRPAATAKVKAVSGKSKLRVDVNPNRGSGYWKFQVQKQLPSGSWKSLKTYRTKGSKEIRTIDLKKGTYRVVVKPKYGYQGTTSAAVWLRR